jgi:hypothetical protein
MGIEIVERRGPKINKWDTPSPAVGKCPCGKLVCLSNPLDNECSCGKCYNMMGSEVIPSWKCNLNGEPHDPFET